MNRYPITVSKNLCPLEVARKITRRTEGAYIHTSFFIVDLKLNMSDLRKKRLMKEFQRLRALEEVECMIHSEAEARSTICEVCRTCALFSIKSLSSSIGCA